MLSFFSPRIDFLTPPTQLTVLEISTTSFTVFWRPPLEYLQNGSALCYVSTVNWTYREGENVLVLQSKVNSTVLQWSVAELLPDYAHQVSMYAALRDWSGPSALVWIRTSPTASMYSIYCMCCHMLVHQNTRL